MYKKINLYLGLLIALIATSCEKQNEIDNSLATVTFTMKGVQAKNQDGNNSTPKDKIAAVLGKSQRFTKELGNGQYLHVDISPLQENTLRADNGTTELDPLETGTKYRIVAYDAAGNYLTHTDEEAGQPKVPELQLPMNQTYKFLFYSYLTKTDMPTWSYQAINLNNLIFQINKDRTITSRLTSSVNPNARIAARTSNMTVVLKPNYAEVNVNINSTVGNIIRLDSVQIDKTYDAAAVRVGTDINHIAPADQPKMFTLPPFKNLGTARVSSDRQALILKDGESHKLTFHKLQIKGYPATDVTVSDIVLNNGVRYSVNFTINSTPPELKVQGSGIIWAPGNLVYNNGNYGFASDQNEIGDYWMWNWLTPKGQPQKYAEWEIANLVYSSGYKAERDPCTKVITQDGYTWRTPTIADYQSIIKEIPGKPNVLNVVEGTYNGTSGVYFGTREVNANNYHKYLFLPRAGIYSDTYPDKNHWSINNGSWYQSAELSKNGQNYSGLQINQGVQNWQAKDYFGDSNYVLTATQIRCVKGTAK